MAALLDRKKETKVESGGVASSCSPKNGGTTPPVDVFFGDNKQKE